MLSEKLECAFEQENGILTPKIAGKYGVSGESLRKAAIRGDIVREERGIYLHSESDADDMYQLQLRFSRGVYSHDSAAMLQNLSTFSPFKHKLTFPYGYHLNKESKDKISAYYVSKDLFSLGVEKVDSWFGNSLNVTSKERTIIDLLRSSSIYPGNDIESIETYLSLNDIDLVKLINYGKLFNIEKIVEEKVLRLVK